MFINGGWATNIGTLRDDTSFTNQTKEKNVFMIFIYQYH